MLYCPKCSQKYKEGSQRFCNNDGSRLIPETSVKTRIGTKDISVFTNLLGRSKPRNDKDEKTASTPRFVKTEQVEPQFETPEKSKIFKSPPEFNHQAEKVKNYRAEKIESDKKPILIAKESSETAKPISRLINPKEIKIDQAELGDRRTKPTGREALNWDNTEILIGETIKGRYRIKEKLEHDSIGINYLADDKIIHGKKAIVRVLMDENLKENLDDKIFAEERVSLSHINHPNIVKFIDSGELPEGKPFIVTEYTEGESVRDILEKGMELNSMRAARIIGQTAYALSEAHQNGILHRNLKPEHIILTVSGAGKEQVKVKDFCVSVGDNSKTDFLYKSPEQIGGQLPTFSSDTYSLGVIAFEMLTGQKPFEAANARGLLKSQKQGLVKKPTDLRADLPDLINNIIAKALSYNASGRYPKARDFGEALYNSLMTISPWDEKTEDEKEIKPAKTRSYEVIAPLNPSEDTPEKVSDESSEPFAADRDIHIPSTETAFAEETDDAAIVAPDVEKTELKKIPKKAAADTLWEKRSPEPTREGNKYITLFSVFGLLILLVGAVLIWQYFENRSEQTAETAPPAQTNNLQSNPTISNADEANNAINNSANGIEVPPLEREIIEPPNSKYFENSIQNLDKELAKRYRGFSLYYPEKWELNKSKTNFLDISKKDEDGYPKEQMLITHYDSNGTFDLDKKKFAELVEKSNEDLRKAPIPNYEVVSQGNITVNNGWKAYEVKFKGKTNFKDQENFEIWGRRIWMPAARPGVKNGFVITMLATSLSDRIESLDDVGKKGDLGDILYTFEPDRNY